MSLINVYGYIRVSDPKQGKGVSLQEQKEAIERYAQKHNLNIIQWFEEKETAAKKGRPMFLHMMKLLHQDKARGIVVHKIDRSARNLHDWATIGDLIESGFEVHFAHETLDLKSRGGRLAADIQAVVASDYVRNLRQETIKGIRGRLKQGFYPFRAPIGYIDTGRASHKQIDPIQGTMVQQLFKLYASKTYTLKELVNKIYEIGLRNKGGKKVSLNGIATILKNPFYIGIMKVKDQTYLGGHEQLIDSNLFNKVQKIREAKSNKKAYKHDYLLRRRIKCSECGYSLIAEKQKGNVYYRCQKAKCPTKTIREDVIENYIGKALQTIQITENELSNFHSLIRENKKSLKEEQETYLKASRLQIKQLEHRIERLTDAYIDAVVDKKTYTSKIEKLHHELRALEDKNEQLADNSTEIYNKSQKYLERAKDVKNSYDEGITEEKRDILETFISNLTSDGKKLCITIRSPFYELSQKGFLLECDPTHDTPRTQTLTYSCVNTSAIIAPPLSEQQSNLVFQYLIEGFKRLLGNWD